MKQFVLLLSFLTLSVAASAQLGTCMPDPAYADSVGVYPLPYFEGENGIPDTACLNTEYQTTFTIIVDTITLQGVSAVPDFIQIDSVVGLPEGLTYQCDPADCKFLPQTPGCAAVFGIPTGPAGEYPLIIYGSGTIGGFFPFEIAFPDEAFAPGEYIVVVREEGDAACTPIDGVEAPTSVASLRNMPNPFSGFTTFELEAGSNETYDFAVMDLFGKVIFQDTWNATAGKNTYEFDGTDLANGIYMYAVRQGNQVKTGKMIVQN